MKTIFTSLAALVLCSTAAFAQFENPFVSFSPEGGPIESRNTTVTIAPTALGSSFAPNAAGVLVQSVAGQGFNQFPTEPVYYPFLNENNKEVSVNLTDASWFLPFFEVYHLQMFAVLADANETPIISDDLDGYVMGITAFTTPDYGPAVWAQNYPSERNFTDEGLTFKRFYETGICTFYFTKEVNLPAGSIGTIVYTTSDGRETVIISDYKKEWDDQLGLYAVTVPIQNDAFDISDIESINVSLSGIRNGDNELINVPSIMAVNNSYSARKSAEKSGVESGLATNDELVNVYNVQGMLVKENVSVSSVNDLPAGMYIVNGKKVLVR